MTYLAVLLRLLTGVVESWHHDVGTREAAMMNAAHRKTPTYQEILKKHSPYISEPEFPDIRKKKKNKNTGYREMHDVVF